MKVEFMIGKSNNMLGTEITLLPTETIILRKALGNYLADPDCPDETQTRLMVEQFDKALDELGDDE